MLPIKCLVIALMLLLSGLTLYAADPPGNKYFKITVVDDQTGRGVPLVELRTVNQIRYFTDSNGIVAFHEPGLMKQKVFISVKSHGYEFPKDGFGFRGKALDVTEGGSAVLKIKRINIAERLYRMTGAGIFADSVLAGQPVSLRQPVLNGQVFGSDSVVNAVYRGKLHWFWGDTLRPAYPLGNYHVPGAISILPNDGGLDPDAGVDLDYFLDDKGFAKPTAPMPGPGPTWINGLVVLRDRDQRERMFAAYVKVRNQLEIYEHGLVEFDDANKRFEKVVQFPEQAPLYPDGHPFQHTVNGDAYVYFAHPYPLVRVRADPDQIRDLTAYEAFTCLKPGTRLDQHQLDRAADGSLRYGWKKQTAVLGPREQAKWIREGWLKPEEAWLQLRDVTTGKPVTGHAGSVYWNAFRRRWVMIVVEQGGTSLLGEVWYAEADTPLGPWVYARKVVTHDRYSFYNPKQHAMFDKHNGRVIYFEGTYTHTFSGNPDQTPRYDYNQVMYKLDLADPRLVLPVPVYQLVDVPDRFGLIHDLKAASKTRPIAFFAPDRPGPETQPVYGQSIEGGGLILYVGEPPRSTDGIKPAPLFHALTLKTTQVSADTLPLFEYASDDGRKRAYSTDGTWSMTGYRRSKEPICRVWRNPMRMRLE